MSTYVSTQDSENMSVPISETVPAVSEAVTEPVLETLTEPVAEKATELKKDDEDPMFFQCPHCDGEVIIFHDEVNCGIFRHANMKDGGQVNPHAPKAVCDKLVAEDKVLGCCKPFELKKNKDGKYDIFACGYK